MNLVGFASEHTVEYAAVAAAKSAFIDLGVSSAPLFYWKTREGGALSNRLHESVLARLIGVFPRRPKLKDEESADVHWKVNSELHSFANEARKFRVPVFAAMPLARSIIELASTQSVYWRQLGGEVGDEHFTWNAYSQRPHSTMDSSEFARTAISAAPIQSWADISSAMDELRWAVSPSNHWLGFAGYKPVYLMIGF